jgi:hypothetical protein
MQSYCKVYQIYKGNYNMVQLPVMWTCIILRKLQVHLRYKSMVWKVATPGGAPQGRPNMEPRDTHGNSSEDTDNSKESSSGKTSSHSQTRGKKRKHSKSHDPEEFKKSKPPTFDGEIKKGEEAEVWLLGLKKYFRVHDYSENLKARIAIFNLNGKASIWWEDLRNVKGIHEKDLSWKQFEKYFKKKYLSEKYFDGKTKEFYELKLGQLTIDEYINKFLELMRYVPYIKDEKVKMQ